MWRRTPWQNAFTRVAGYEHLYQRNSACPARCEESNDRPVGRAVEQTRLPPNRTGADPRELNDILWLAVKGTTPPRASQ